MEYNFKEHLLWKLHNSVKGTAHMILHDGITSEDKRKEQFAIIEEVLHYVDNYDENKKKLEDYDRLKALYAEWQRDWLDDGR